MEQEMSSVQRNDGGRRGKKRDWGKEEEGNIQQQPTKKKPKKHICGMDGCTYDTDDFADLFEHASCHYRTCLIPGCPFRVTCHLQMRGHLIETHQFTHICQMCDAIFPNSLELHEHSEVHPPVQSIRCEVGGCPFSTDEKVRLVEHMVEIHDYYRCADCLNDCLLYFADRGDLVNHMVRVHHCILCSHDPAGCYYLGSRDDHMVLKHGYSVYCHLCTTVFETEARRREHVEEAHPPRRRFGD